MSSSEEATELLAKAQAAERAVNSKAAWDYRAYFGWAIWLLVAIPPLDFLPHFWGTVVVITSMAGTLLTVLYFATRSRQVHLGRAMQTKRWLLFWGLWTPWYIAWVILAVALEKHFALAWTTAGVAGAIPCLVAGYLSWRAR